MRRPYWLKPIWLLHVWRHNRHAPNACADPANCGEWIADHA